MTEPKNSPCCSDPSTCCGASAPPPPKRKLWRAILFILILLVGVALAAHTLMGKRNACCAPSDCSKTCEE